MSGRRKGSGPYYASVYPAWLWSKNRAFRAASSDAKLTYLLLLTVPERSTEGLFVLPAPTAAHYIGWPPERLTAALDELESVGLVETDRDVDLIWLPDVLVLQKPQGRPQVTGAAAKLADLPPSPLRARFVEKCRKVCVPLAEALAKLDDWADDTTFPQVGETLCDTPSQTPPQRVGGSSISNSTSNSISNSPLTTPSASPRVAVDDCVAAVVADSLLPMIGCFDQQAGADVLRYVTRALGRGWPVEMLEDCAAAVAAMSPAEIETTPLKVLTGLLRKRASADPPDNIQVPTLIAGARERRGLLDDERTPCPTCDVGFINEYDDTGALVAAAPCPDCHLSTVVGGR